MAAEEYSWKQQTSELAAWLLGIPPCNELVQHLKVSFTKWVSETRLLGWFCKDEIFEKWFLTCKHTDTAFHKTLCAKLFYRLKQHYCWGAFFRLRRYGLWSPERLCAGDHKAVSLFNLQPYMHTYEYIYIYESNQFPHLFVPCFLSLPVCSTKSTSKMCQHYFPQDHLRHMLRDL